MKYVLHAVFFLLGMAAAVAAPAGAAKAGSARAGKAIFAHTCANCHSTRIGVNEVGPSLLGVVGRAPASVPGFVYSDAMKANATPWTPEALDAYLAVYPEDPDALLLRGERRLAAGDVAGSSNRSAR